MFLESHSQLTKEKFEKAILRYNAKSFLEAKTLNSALHLYFQYHGFHSYIYRIQTNEPGVYIGKGETRNRFKCRINGVFGNERLPCNKGGVSIAMWDYLQKDCSKVEMSIIELLEDKSNIDKIEQEYIINEPLKLYNKNVSKFISTPELINIEELEQFFKKYLGNDSLDYNSCWIPGNNSNRLWYRKSVKSFYLWFAVLYKRFLEQDFEWQPGLGLQWSHSCINNSRSNFPCCNPTHGEFKTNSENIKDIHRDSYKWETVKEIRSMYLSGEITNSSFPSELILDKYQISSSNVRDILMNRRWVDDNYQRELESKRMRGTQSKYIGISKRKKRWVALSPLRGKRIISTHKDEIDAVISRDNFIIDNNLWTPEYNLDKNNKVLLNSIIYDL